MKTRSALLMLGALAMAWFVSPAAGAEDQLIVGWGDSLTEGYCTEGYLPSLASQMAAIGRGSEMVNCGYGGETSATSLSRLQRTLAGSASQYLWGDCSGHIWSRDGWYDYLNGSRPEFILIWLGANDVIHGVSTSTTLFNIRKLIELSRAYRITPLVATVTPDERYGENNCTIGTLGTLNNGIRSLAAGLNVPLSDNCLSIPTWGVKDCGDGLHPNEWGDMKIAWTWLGVLPDRSDYIDEEEKAPVVLDGLYLLLQH